MIDRPDLRAHLRAAYEWIERSRSPRTGGSRAYYAPLLGWSATYPETTGYIIPTVLRAGAMLDDPLAPLRARRFGEFLLDIQQSAGGWFGLTWPPRHDAQLSVFNSAQIVEGLCALARSDGDPQWLEAVARGARWLARGVDADGAWASGGYRSDTNPAYYTQVAWPLLEAWSLTGEAHLRTAAERVLARLLGRRTLVGSFRGWGFAASDTAFTHTIAYTLRGFLESARLLDAWDLYARPVLGALRRLAQDAVTSGGSLPGAYDVDWRPELAFTCLTGNAQIAICAMIAWRRTDDPVYLDAARRLVDGVCRRQRLNHPLSGVRGAVAGSAPIWGRYMRGRYPNWAAKYLCDAILELLDHDETAGRSATRAVRHPLLLG